MKIITVILCLLSVLTLGAAVTKEDYSRAERFLPHNLDKLVYKLRVTPHWLEKGPQFWYLNRLPENRKEFVLVDSSGNKRKPAFDHARLAKNLKKAAGKKYSADRLPFDTITFSPKKNSITFTVDSQTWRCSLPGYHCKKIDKEKKKEAGLSPDGKWLAYVKDYNLYLREVATDAHFKLTSDGMENYSYAVPLPSARDMVARGKMDIKQDVDVMWAPDSERFITYRIDSRRAGRMHLVQSMPPGGGRPRLFSFAYPLPGETDLPKAELKIFDVIEKKKIDVAAPSIPLLYYGDPLWYYWFPEANGFYYVDFSRGFGTFRLRKTDPKSGKTVTLIEESCETYIDPNIWDMRILKNNAGVLWFSERDGWNHIYRYDASGKLKNQVTRGPWAVRYFVHVDHKKQRIYFMAGGKEKGREPYYRNLYRVNFDGSGLRLLTPENADHTVNMSPDGKYIVDTYSVVTQSPVTLLRRASDGKVLRTLEKADIKKLLAAGWNYPEPFCVKARDGKTDIYGVLYRPSNFDPSIKYPVIDKIYTGPHSYFVPKGFHAYRSWAQSFAELGFIVIEIDGMGTGKRSREFHNVSYKNLGDGGIDDHIAGFRQLAAKYPYMDLERVGIFGFSAGGYDTVHAMCTHPEFYKVGIAASGNHDHRMDKTWWNELWMGYPVKEHYVEQSNLTNAHRLQGKLMLAHGDVDENVNPSCTLQLVDALIKANKDFDLLIFPNRGHYL
ncbi:MAG: prolyl oligopeptidase family serine peptidase, partial [bacterium]|nr:prolyl oligopeptidase family serine peptidase [bacterium]